MRLTGHQPLLVTHSVHVCKSTMRSSVSEVTHCYYCIYRHCTRDRCSVSTRKYPEKQSTHQYSTKCAKRDRRDVQGSFCPLQGEGCRLHCTCYAQRNTQTEESQTGKQVFRVKKLVGRQWGAPNSNYLLAMGWPLFSCHQLFSLASL